MLLAFLASGLFLFGLLGALFLVQYNPELMMRIYTHSLIFNFFLLVD
jgi:hypothetical protein